MKKKRERTDGQEKRTNGRQVWRWGLMLALFAALLANTSCVSFAALNGNCRYAEIDRADALMWQDIYFDREETAKPESGELRTLAQPIGEVRYKLDGQACADHRWANGDATNLEAGTPIYALADYKPTFRVVADGRVYQALVNPHARTIGDLYDIEGKVKEISFKEGRIVLDPEEERTFTDLYLNGKYEGMDAFAKRRLAGPIGFRIRLKDGSDVSGTYFLTNGPVMHPGMAAPDRLRDLVEGKLRQAGYLPRESA
ncbi:hypothetical protein [Cohnella sp. REN36]|uniref:hypothetical protein n=1 Tax=Cohnella sp. REN36 TaxID=2887347 RepID=UPI001D14FF03|nr:hypothetical protein [Cohnella sp. REN36]MCC3374026.1 hypothetical protein [Cohnella sp. REN36]